MRCAMIILNYNDGERALSLAKKSAEYNLIEKVIVVDNASTDFSYERLTTEVNSKIDVIHSSKNNGFAAGNNLGVRHAIEKYQSEYIIFANTDTIFKEDDISACINELQSRNNLGLVSLRIKDISEREERSAWKFKTYYSYLLFYIWIYRRWTYNKHNYKDYSEQFQYVDIVRGSFMCFKGKALQDAGFFDEGTFLYYEEEIIAKRLACVGYRVGIITDRFYIHNHIESGQSNHSFIQKNLNKSLLYFLTKYYNINFFKKIILQMFMKLSFIEQDLTNYVKDYFKHYSST